MPRSDPEVQFNARKTSRSDTKSKRSKTKSETKPTDQSKRHESESAAARSDDEPVAPETSNPKSKAKSSMSAATKSSKKSRKSVMAKKMALEAEAAALDERERIQQEILQLQQRAKRLDLKVAMDTLQAEQEALEEETEEGESESEAEGNASCKEEGMEKVQGWLDSQLQHIMKPTRQQQQSSYTGPPQRQMVHTSPVHLAPGENDHQLDPLAPVFRPDLSQGAQKAVSATAIEEMVHSLHMPKVEMMTFDGEPMKFWTFMKSFDNNIGRHNVDEHAKLSRLLQYCKGRAYRVIEGCAAMQEGGYHRARELLHERFGDRYAISTSWINRVTSGARITNDSLQEFADELVSFRETLHAIGCLSEVNQRALVQVAERLPTYIQYRWKRQVTKLRERGASPEIDNLIQFIQSAAREVNDPVFGDLGVSNKPKPASQTQRRGFHGTTVTAENSSIGKTQDWKECPACHSSKCQSLFKCGEFLKRTPEERFHLAKNHRLCYNCLRRGHSSVKCKEESTCIAEGCKIKHTKFLHTARYQRVSSAPATSSLADPPGNLKSENAVCSYVTTRAPRVALPVVKIRVTADSGCTAYAYALLDSGSTNTFCSTGLLQKLRSRGQKTSLSLSTLESQGRQLETAVHQLEVSDPRGQNKVIIRQAYATPLIPVSMDSVVKQEDLGKWKHLRGLELPELSDLEEVEMLIGQDCPEVIMPLEVRASESEPAPFAIRSLFGWTINGILGGNGRCSGASVSFVSMTLERQVEEFWKVEGAQLNSGGRGLSVEDQRALDIMRGSIRKEDGHYQVAIPFREKKSMPNNKVLAETRLASLGKRLQCNPALKEAYTESMESLIQKGHAEKVDESLANRALEGGEWYLPHHPVINPRKSKIRVVFDCAARHQGVALNDKVLQGPDFTNSLLGILLRFRQHPVAISADVEAMFHQVMVPTEDRDVLRYLWWPDGDTSKVPGIYRMKVHLFGGTWSPSVCSYALRQTAKDNSNDFRPEVTSTVCHDFYVDDLLKSFRTTEEAAQMATELPRLLEKGGFRLCKWVSNKKEVLETMPGSERATGLQDLNHHALPVERTLGVFWDVNTDSFTFTAKLTSHSPTRRGLLGAVCSVYDPLGFITPFTIKGKRLVQDLAREGTGWDDPLSKQFLEKWETWSRELAVINGVRIDRCLQPTEFGEVHRAELHHFSDASTHAYGSASYIRFVNTKGQVSCSLLFTRSRVAPLKQMTIPRLELAASVLSVQQDEMLRRELSIPIDDSVFWTDSAIVMAYIRNERKRFHTFVANRLAMIHAGSSVRQWRHVPSERNPADDITRGLSIQELIRNHRWFHGPEFLYQPTYEEMTEPPVATIDDDPEVKRSVTICSTDGKKDVVHEFITKFSSWMRLKRATAWFIRFQEYLIAKAERRDLTSVMRKVTVEDLQKAEEAIIRYVQHEEYTSEIECLQAGRTVNKSSRLRVLDPMLTPDAVVACGTRIQQIGNFTPPVILPKDHHASALIAKHYHEFSGHAGREHTIAEVRMRFWIPGIRTLVRRVIKQCRRCRRLFSLPTQQRMADLPQERLATDEPPFVNVGVDCFGPFTTKLGRKTYKRYGCIFTCLTSRAVHLELLDSMDTCSFLNALQRFMSRRGYPKTIWSDNGTNLVGAERELRQSLQQWNQQAIDAFLCQRTVQWKFNPPGASHMGGVWERLIRSVRRTLRAVMMQQVINDDALSTLFCTVEGILNSRPLTTVSDDPGDLEPLTPNHLLQLRPMPLMPPGVFDQKDCYVRRRWRQVQYLANVFWRRWLREYLPLIQLRQKWREIQRNLNIGDIVLIVDYAIPRNQWQLGRITNVTAGRDGLVRSAQVRTRTSTITRPITKLCYLEGRS